MRLNSGPGAHAHETESYEQFNNRYLTFFSSCNDLFELQRGLNNCFAYDLVPAPSVIEAALQSARRINNYGSAVRILDAVKVKVENPGQYKTYLDELKGTIQELGELFALLWRGGDHGKSCGRAGKAEGLGMGLHGAYGVGLA